MGLETTNYIRDRDFQIRTFGWVLLLVWIAVIVYIARDFFFPKLYNIDDLDDIEKGEETEQDHVLLTIDELGEFV
ncbi:hypothetical protein FO519_003969 [Halicephalobus sp. NKZ332]|nr:hypothetical protein FO519_003969 [Halicephalobus sp. NKZ332]